MKKVALLLALVVLVALSSTAFAEDTTIYWSQWQTEYTDALAHLLSEYEAQHPGVAFEIDMAGSNSVYETLLAAGELPDVIMTIGGTATENWLDYLTPLTGEICWENLGEASKSWLTFNDNGWGVPVTLMSYGFIYNVDLFERAGITETPKTYSDLLDVVDKLEAAGITPFSTMFDNLWWLGHFCSETVCDNIRNNDENGWDYYYGELAAGEMSFVDIPEFDRFLDLLDLMDDHDAYAEGESLSGSQNQAFVDLAMGNAAMLYIGQWATNDLYNINPNANLDIFGTVYSDNPEDYRLSVDINCCWHVTNGENADVCIDVLNWMCTDETALDILLNEFGIISPYQGAECTLTSPIALTTFESYANGETENWLMNSWASQAQAESSWADVQSYLLGDIDRTECLENCYEIWYSYCD